MQLSKSYGNVQALKDVTLQIPAGSVFGLIGRNGAGKSTALHTLIGLLRPDTGWARIGGYDTFREGVRARRELAFVSETAALYPWLTGQETAGYWRRLSNVWNEATFKQCAARFNLPLTRKVGKFSKGMRTQLLLALAVAKEPQVYILDEPTSGLDPIMRRQVLQLLKEEAVQAGRTVLLSSHVLAEVSTACTHVAVMDGGSLKVSSELGTLLAQWRTYVFVSRDPSMETLLGSLNVAHTRSGDTYSLIVARDHDAVLARLRAASLEDLHVSPMDLEEVFISIISEGGS